MTTESLINIVVGKLRKEATVDSISVAFLLLFIVFYLFAKIKIAKFYT